MIIALMIVIALLLLFDVIFTAATFARLDGFLRELERQMLARRPRIGYSMFELAVIFFLFLIYMALVSMNSYLKRIASRVDPQQQPQYTEENRKVWV